jgi:hypothetical protein
MTKQAPRAPRPGVTKRANERAAASQVMSLTIRDETYRLGIGAISMAERSMVRKALDLPLESFLNVDRFGLDSLFVIWWLARRASGEPNLSFAEANAQFPTDLEASEIDLSLDDADGNDPEA